MVRPSRLFFFPENEPNKLNVQDGRKAIEADEPAFVYQNLLDTEISSSYTTPIKKEALIIK